MEITFIKDFDYREPEKYGVTIGYRAGWTIEVEEACAEAAIAAGAAILAEESEDYEDEGE